jgi:hypothetical protein
MNTKTKMLTSVAAFRLLTLTAMTSRADDTDTTTNAITAPPLSPYQPITVGAEAGTTGFGGGANWRFSNHFGVGGAFDYLSASYNRNIQGNDYSVKLLLQSEPVTLNWYPWKNHSFRVNVGALFNQFHSTGTATGNNLDLNGTPYTGTLNLDLKQQPVDPYLSIGGNLYFDKRHHVSLGSELGVFYTGEPRVSLTANTVPPANPADVQAEQDQIKHYARYAEFWPVLKVSLNFSF